MVDCFSPKHRWAYRQEIKKTTTNTTDKSKKAHVLNTLPAIPVTFINQMKILEGNAILSCTGSKTALCYTDYKLIYAQCSCQQLPVSVLKDFHCSNSHCKSLPKIKFISILTLQTLKSFHIKIKTYTLKNLHGVLENDRTWTWYSLLNCF